MISKSVCDLRQTSFFHFHASLTLLVNARNYTSFISTCENNLKLLPELLIKRSCLH